MPHRLMRSKLCKNIFGLWAIFMCCVLIRQMFAVSDASSQEILSRPPFERDDPGALLNSVAEVWEELPAGLHVSFGSMNARYSRSEVPLRESVMEWSGTAWRGERISAQVLFWSNTGIRQLRWAVADFRTAEGAVIASSAISTRLVRYVLADDERQSCGPRREDIEPTLQPDPLDASIQRYDLPAKTIRPVWVQIDVPASAAPGIYSGTLRIEAEGGIHYDLPMKLEVLDVILPPPAQWTFHLDLWQYPQAAARHHDVVPFSREHLLILEPVMRMLANAGQKCISAFLIHEPWGHQTYHDVEAMIEWIKKEDGAWVYDYAKFDTWVDFCMRCGITEQLNCYSMVPWSNSFRYLDEPSGDYRYVHAEAGSDEYKAHWEPFLKDFVRHLKQKGWLEKTCIAMDERELEAMQQMIAFLKSAAPALRVALAGHYYENIQSDIHDYCFYIDQVPDEQVIKDRVKQGHPTTFYVCCVPPHPNVHTFSPPVEAQWMGWHAAATGYNGFLFWAYNAWTEDPLYDTRYVTWPAGDCYLVYPGGRSSIRFERLRDGIEDFEKIRILRSRASSDSAKTKLAARLDAVLSQCTYQRAKDGNIEPFMKQADDVLIDVSRKMAKDESP
jgi:hypothetical protein